MATATRSSKTQVHEISLKNIIQDKDIQPRSEINLELANEYSDAMLSGDEFPPVVLFFDGVTYWLADGFHRFVAACKAGLTSIKAIVYQGGKEDAILYSVGANAQHGARRSNADKRRVVFKLLDHPEWSLWSDAEIARKCKVSPGTVSRLRNGSPGVMGHDVDLRVTANGRLQQNGTERVAAAEPEPRFKMPPRSLTKSELDEQYAARVARHLRKADSSLRRNVETEVGNAEMADKTRCYFLATAHDRHTMFAAIGKAVVVSCKLGLSPVIFGHFPKTLRNVIDIAAEIGVAIMSPEALIQEASE